MRDLILVGFGGGLGALLRFKSSGIILNLLPNSKFPWATLLVNILGCFVAGVVFEMLQNNTNGTEDLKLFLLIGVLGGFTTFSAFGLESISLLKNAQFLFFAMNVFLSVFVGLVAVWVGIQIGQRFIP